MSLPIVISALSIEIRELYLADEMPTPTEGYEIIELKDLGYTKLWIEFRIVTACTA